MERFITTKEASVKWKISARRINVLCKTGRIQGAYKKDKQWLIPADAKKPADKRLKNKKEIQGEAILNKIPSRAEKKLPLPVGISDYKRASSDYYYVDKTLMIRDFIDERPQVSLFTRPRRFGKTLNMDMFRVFFEKTDEDTSIYFRDKKIWACGEEYRRHQGKYPVIYVTFKDVKCETWQMAYDLIFKILRNEFERHRELLESSKLSFYEKKYMISILEGNADISLNINANINENDIVLSFLNLSRMLHTHYGVAPIIIIDEYDTPIQQGYIRGYYDKVVDFMRMLFSGGLKDNPHLSYGFLTGILRVAKESIFSGLNNLKVNSVLEHQYSEYFGFTSDEVKEMVNYYEVPKKYEEIKEWYDGYQFGKVQIFNPWSVIGYFSNECIPRAFWQYTGSNDIISEILENATADIYEKLESLMQGKSFVTHIDTSVIYPQIQKNPSSIYSFLLVTGYLKATVKKQTFGGEYICEVSLPNKEVSYVYSKEILSQLENIISIPTVISIQEALYTMDTVALQKYLESFLLHTISFYDTANETFYHGLVLGLCATMENQYYITSNREAGNGRFDIQMLPSNKKLPGILIELKAEKDCDDEELEKLAKAALNQINDKMYYVEMERQGIGKILKYGIAFSGKKAWIHAQNGECSMYKLANMKNFL